MIVASAGKQLLAGIGKALVLVGRRGPGSIRYPIVGLAISLLAASESGLIGVMKTGIQRARGGLSTPEEAPNVLCYRVAPSNHGPTVFNLTAVPNPTEGAKTVRVSALLVDDYGNDPGVAGATLVMEGSPDLAMKPTDGAFDSDSEEVYLDLEVSSLVINRVTGKYTIAVSGTDREGAEGGAEFLDIEVTDQR